ncbi:MAG: transporter substrate-binding domain-containing protein [Aliarcobacter sp.]
MNKFILKLFLLFLLTFKLCASNVEILNNNINNNLDSLTFQLKFLISDNEKYDEITNLLKLYYQHFGNIEAIEIYHLKTPIHKSYKKDTELIILERDALPIEIYDYPQISEKKIIDKNNNTIGKLIVYLKKDIPFTKEELEYLKNKTILKVQNDSNLTPYNFTENGIAKGYSIDYINLIANTLALKVEYTQGKWDDFMNQLDNNELDLMLNVLKSKSREERFLFSDSPYLWLTPAMITRVGEKDFNSFSQLDGKTIALVKGYHSYDRVKKDYPNVNIYAVDNTLEMIKAVSEGKADVSYGLKDVLEYNINKHLITNLKITNNTDDDDKFGFYFTFNKENELLRTIIYKAQNAISKKEIEELNQKWFKKISKTIKEGENFLLNKEELAFLDNKKKITMCVDPNFMPYEKITHEGNYVSIIADIINQISKNTSIKFELIPTKSFGESFNLVKDKSCDIFYHLQYKLQVENLFLISHKPI